MNEQRIGYEVFARFYDQVMGEPTERVSTLRDLIDKHAPDARSILELACGTGSILEVLEGRYDLAGLDLSLGMLDRARQKIPRADLRQADMTNFNFGRKFDIVLCVFDSINHLMTFPLWEAVFKNVDEHLNPLGIFIFDMNTRHKLENIAAAPTFKQPFAGKEMELKVLKDDRNIYHWTIKINEPTAGGSELHEEDIPEVAFDKDQVLEGIQKHLDVVELIDEQHSAVTNETNRIYFVCRKKTHHNLT